MTHALQTFSEGASRAFLDNAVFKVKSTLTVTDRSSTIDCFFKPIITALFDVMQTQSIQKRSIAILNKGRIFKKTSTKFSNQAFLAFLLAKTAINVTISLARDAFSKNTMYRLRAIHDGMESLFPLASAIITIASMNFIYISAFFLYQGLSYLGEHRSLSRDMNEICQYSSTVLGVTSFLYLGISSFKIL